MYLPHAGDRCHQFSANCLGSTVFYPSDAISCERAVELAANTKGVCFIRTSRPATEVVYKNDTIFEVQYYVCNIVCVCVQIVTNSFFTFNKKIHLDWEITRGEAVCK